MFHRLDFGRLCMKEKRWGQLSRARAISWYLMRLGPSHVPPCSIVIPRSGNTAAAGERKNTPELHHAVSSCKFWICLAWSYLILGGQPWVSKIEPKQIHSCCKNHKELSKFSGSPHRILLVHTPCLLLVSLHLHTCHTCIITFSWMNSSIGCKQNHANDPHCPTAMLPFWGIPHLWTKPTIIMVVYHIVTPNISHYIPTKWLVVCV
jgi:hypothetical protein